MMTMDRDTLQCDNKGNIILFGTPAKPKKSVDCSDIIESKDVLQQMINGAIMNAFSSFGGQNIENSIDTTGISKGELCDMPIERRRVIIGMHDN